ncbi:MAG: AAA family ATPase [Arthrobacter sp.]
MTENTPAPAEQALPSRRARRAAQNSEGSAAAVDGVRERPESRVSASRVSESKVLESGLRAVPGEAVAEGEQPMTRRRARVELRSWGADAPDGAAEGGSGVSQGQTPVLLAEEETELPGEALAQPVPGESETPEEAEPEAETDADPVAAQVTEAGPEAETRPGPGPQGGPDPETQPFIPEIRPVTAEPETTAEPEKLPAAADAEPEDGTGHRRAVVLPELPVAPPGAYTQETENTAAEAAAPNGNETNIETETERTQDPAPELDVKEPEQPADHPSGLPLDPVLMPSDLRERTRLAVRGEPNDVRRATFLDTQTAKIPATRGFRGFLASLGIRIAPSARELDERQDTRTVSQHWPGPRTISVVNGKGGANKTPTTVMLAAIFARNGGGPVLAWDNNETRGTLGWRTEQAQHDATVMDLLPETGLLLSPAAQSAMLARFVHHQTDDKYDVLRSNPNVLASEQKVTKADFDALHSVASKYFRLNIVDSGNDESAERWLRMIDHTDQLVIATTTVEEHAEAGALLLEALQERGGRYAELARGAVVIVSQADRNGTEAQARRVAEAFKVLARAAVTIPYDPALVKGQIRYASLRPATQRAWLKAAAAVAGGL